MSRLDGACPGPCVDLCDLLALTICTGYSIAAAVVTGVTTMFSAVSLGEHLATRAIRDHETLIGNDLAASIDGIGSGTGGTRWGATPVSGTTADPAYWQVDLGKAYSIKQIVIRWETAYGKDYDLQTSFDGNTWVTIKQVRNATSGTHTHTGLSGVGQFVRMQGITRGTNFGYSFWEFEINGVGTESKTIPVSAGSHTWSVRAIDGANNATNNSNGTVTFTKQ